MRERESRRREEDAITSVNYFVPSERVHSHALAENTNPLPRAGVSVKISPLVLRIRRTLGEGEGGVGRR